MLWQWLIDNWAWANGGYLRQSGRSLRELNTRDLPDAAYRLFTDWSCMDQNSVQQMSSIQRYFREREQEFETGEPVLPGWAAIGDAQARYGPADGANPLATE